MKTSPSSRRRSRAFIANAMVITIAMVIVTGIAFAFRQHARSLDVQAKTQVRIDYTQKEDALLRALLQVVPNKAIGAMQTGSAINGSSHSWPAIFQEAIALANAETALDPGMLELLGTGLFSANPGDGSLGAVSSFIAPVAGSGALVNPGDTRETGMLLGPIGDKLPAPLHASQSNHHALDALYPIISQSKAHSQGWTKGLHLSPADYPLYNLLEYPDIRFGYARPGDLFVAKRNWWAFSITFGASGDGIGVPGVKKNYVLSIYEIPSQLPMSAAGFMSVGQHGDGSAWSNAQIRGGVFADRLQTQGTVAVADGLFSARSSLAFSSSTTVDGVTLGNDFDALGVRESREAGDPGGFHRASVGGNVGRVAFIPLNTGTSFLSMQNDGASNTRLSPTGWHSYTNGAIQASMRVEIRRMQSASVQLPTSIRFRYRNPSGNLVSRTYTRGSSWPTPNQSGGSAFPFQTETLDIGRHALVIHLDKLPAFLNSLSDAAGLGVNHSLLVHVNPAHSSVNQPSVPSTAADPAIVLRGGADMSPFTSGFSLVSILRAYVSESLNAVPIPAPAGSGLPSDEPFFPPISLFAPEKRFGDSLSFDQPIEIAGQLNSLKVSSSDAFRPLDLVSGADELVHTNQIKANLSMLRSPAQLPPIHLMNWLVTIEEIHDGAGN